MKAIKFLALILALATLSCMVIGCSNEEEENMDLPERDFYELTVSFQIKDADGKIIVEAKDYNYKGHEEPTILNIISDYLYIFADYKCNIENGTLVQVGNKKARTSKGEYWAFAKGIDHDASELNKDIFIDGRMSEFNCKDEACAEFTIVFVSSSAPAEEETT